jgi:outer membrane receptor protein involved in Fe transport
VSADLGVPGLVNNTATGNNLGIYLQDTWKPLPSLTLGLGVRYDFEDLSSFGYTSFDPAAERDTYDAVMEASGVDMNPRDTIANSGLCMDPVHDCHGGGDIRLATMTNVLRKSAFSRLTRHNQDVEIVSRLLAGVTGGAININGAFGQKLLVRAPEEFSISNSNLAPRLSLSWDPWADGKTMVFGSWGRYYDKLFLSSLVQEQGPDTVSRTYRFDADGIDDHGMPNNRLGDPFFAAPISVFQVSRDLSTPYSDEWTAGFRRELVPEVLVSLRYIHRDYHDQLQDIDINHHTVVDPNTGKLADHIGNASCDFAGCDNIPDGAPDLYVENFYHNRVLRLGNFNEQTYRGWEIEFVRRLKRKWQLEASYTYSVAQGDAESFLSELGNDPSLTEYEPGYLDYDQRHVVKINAVAFLPGDWRLGLTANWASGLPYSPVAYYYNSDDVGYSQRRRIFGQFAPSSFGFTSENRNQHRNEATYTFNTRVMKSFILGKAAASAFLEVYNLLNSDPLRVSVMEQIPPHVAYSSLDGTGVQEVRPASEKIVGERNFGRRFQVGFQIDF